MNGNIEEKTKILKLLFYSYQILSNSDTEFSNLLYEAYQKIENSKDYKIICSRISQICNQYILEHINHIPKPVGELNTLVQEISKRCRLMVGSIFNDALYDVLDKL